MLALAAEKPFRFSAHMFLYNRRTGILEMVSKGSLIAGAGIVLVGAAAVLLPSGRDKEVRYEEGACYYLAFTKGRETGAEWKKIDCSALEALLELHPETAYVDADGTVHSTIDPPAEEESDEDDSCQNPHDEGLGIDEKIGRVACWYDLRPDLLYGLWKVESGLQQFNPEGGVKVSYAGAIGIGQVMHGTSGRSAVDNHVLDIWREVDNMELGAQVLARKCDAAVSIAGANGFETRPASGEEPCGAIHYVCMGAWGNAWPAYGSVEGALVDEWYDSPEEVMARAYNGVSCGGDLVGLLGWARGRAASYWTIYYVEKVQDEGGTADHSFDDAP